MGYTAVNQASLEIAAGDASNLSVNGGTIEQVKVTGVGSADLSSASVTVLIVTAQQGLDVRAGTVRELRVSQPDVCPAGSSAASGVYVGGVTSNKMLYNGTERSAETYRTNCAEVIIGDEYDDVY